MLTKRVIGGIVCVSLLALANAGRAENLAYQFICDGNTRTGWLDERISLRTMFEQPEPGQKYFYAENDCRPYGIRRCTFVVASQDGHWDEWTRRRNGLSCNEICLDVQAVDGQLNRSVQSANVDITRYKAAFTSARTIAWRNHTHGGQDTPTSRLAKYRNGRRVGYRFCWNNGAWGDNYWATKYDPDSSDPNANGRMTEVSMTDGDSRRHTFRVLGYYDIDDEW